MIESLLTPHQWLQASALTRLKLHNDFGLIRSAGPVVITQNGHTKVESDGHTIEDLRKLNVQSMQDYTGSKSEDINVLFSLCVDKAEGREIKPAKKATHEKV